MKVRETGCSGNPNGLARSRERIIELGKRDTHTGATQAYNGHRFQDACCADDPGQSKEQDDPQDVLEAGQVDAHEGPHLRALRRAARRSHESTAKARKQAHVGEDIRNKQTE